MGYRSSVAIAVAMESEENMKELMSVYALNMHVQKHNLLPEWTVGVMNDTWVALFHQDDTKWYDTYPDVQGFEAIIPLVRSFAEERDMKYAYRRIRIGEEMDDVEIDYDESEGVGVDLAEFLADTLYVSRSLENELQLEPTNDNVSDTLTQKGTD
jgi:hypothetical protein